MPFLSRITVKEPCGVNRVHASGVLCNPTNILETYLPFLQKRLMQQKVILYVCVRSLHQNVNGRTWKQPKYPVLQNKQFWRVTETNWNALLKEFYCLWSPIHCWVTTWPSWAMLLKVNKPKTGLSMDWQSKFIYFYSRLTTKQCHSVVFTAPKKPLSIR